jgi:sec-independent protein translocase protein TatB
MLGIGWTEMLVIGVVALIVIGPKDLPMLMKRVGQFAGSIRRMGSEFQREINKSTGLDEIKSLRTSITAPLKKTADEIKREFNTMTPTGGVKPSGALKPADPKVENVTDAIKEKAGMTPAAAAMTTAVTSAVAAKEETAKAAETVPPVKGKRPGAADVEGKAAEPKPAPRRKSRAKSDAAASPAPIEAIAPVKDEAIEPPVEKTQATPKPATKRAPRSAKTVVDNKTTADQS